MKITKQDCRLPEEAQLTQRKRAVFLCKRNAIKLICTKNVAVILCGKSLWLYTLVHLLLCAARYYSASKRR